MKYLTVHIFRIFKVFKYFIAKYVKRCKDWRHCHRRSSFAFKNLCRV